MPFHLTTATLMQQLQKAPPPRDLPPSPPSTLNPLPPPPLRPLNPSCWSPPVGASL